MSEATTNKNLEVDTLEGALSPRDIQRRLYLGHGACLTKESPGREGILLLGPPGVGKTQLSIQAAEMFSREYGYKLVHYELDLFKKMQYGNKQKTFDQLTPAEIEGWMEDNGKMKTNVYKKLGEMDDKELQDWTKGNGELLTEYGKPLSSLNEMQLDSYIGKHANDNSHLRKTAADLTTDELDSWKRNAGNKIKTDFPLTLNYITQDQRKAYLKKEGMMIVGMLPCARMPASGTAGIPTMNKDEAGEKKMDYAVPDFFKTMGDFPHAIMNLDEITQAHGLEAYFNLVVDGQFQQTKLPEHCMIIGTGNLGLADGTTSREDGGQAFKVRFTTYRMKTVIDHWVEDFARPNKVHPAMIGLSQMEKDKFQFIQIGYLKDMNVNPKTKYKAITPNVRSLTTISENFIELERKVFGKDWEKKETITEMSEKELEEKYKEMRSVIVDAIDGGLGMDLGESFWRIYKIAITDILPKIHNALKDSKYEFPQEFVDRMNGVKNSDETFGLRMAYVDYLAKRYLANFNTLEEKLRKVPELKDVPKAQFDVTLEKYRASISANFVRALLPLPPSERNICVHAVKEYAKIEEPISKISAAIPIKLIMGQVSSLAEKDKKYAGILSDMDIIQDSNDVWNDGP